MGDFLAAPFLLIVQVSIYIASFLNGKGYIIAEMQEDEDEE